MGCTSTKIGPRHKSSEMCALSDGEDELQLNAGLTSSEKRLIRSTWECLAVDKRALGTKIFLGIFELSPMLKELFPFRHAEDDSIPRHPLFIAHATRFVNAIQSTIDNLDSLHVTLLPTLVTLGRAHANIPGFNLDYMCIFTQTIVDVWRRELGSVWCIDIMLAWNKVLDIIVTGLQQGCQETD